MGTGFHCGEMKMDWVVMITAKLCENTESHILEG